MSWFVWLCWYPARAVYSPMNTRTRFRPGSSGRASSARQSISPGSDQGQITRQSEELPGQGLRGEDIRKPDRTGSVELALQPKSIGQLPRPRARRTLLQVRVSPSTLCRPTIWNDHPSMKMHDRHIVGRAALREMEEIVGQSSDVHIPPRWGQVITTFPKCRHSVPLVLDIEARKGREQLVRLGTPARASSELARASSESPRNLLGPRCPITEVIGHFEVRGLRPNHSPRLSC